MGISNNIFDTALIFEGGGMRNSYTAAVLCYLLEEGIYFDYAAGISAGATHCVNYISRDIDRARRSFVDLVCDKDFGGWGSFFKGKGYFNSDYIYGKTAYAKESLPFDFKTFTVNPAQMRIGAYDMRRGGMKYFSKNDVSDLSSLMNIVRASSSMPFFMPKTIIGDDEYVDGGIGGGIALDIAKHDGYEKFFVVLSRPKGYRKKSVKIKGAIKSFYWRYPQVYNAISKRYIKYNKTLDELEQLEKQGKAFLVYPDVMPVSSRETDYGKLYKSFDMGYEQARRDVEKYRGFLGIGEKGNI